MANSYDPLLASMNSVVDLLRETKDVLCGMKGLLEEIKSNGANKTDVKVDRENIGPVQSDIRSYLKDLKGSKKGAYAQTDTNLLKIISESKDSESQNQAVKSDKALEYLSPLSTAICKEIPEEIQNSDTAISRPQKAIEEPPGHFDMTAKEISEALYNFLTAVGKLDEELDRFATGIRHIGSSKWVIDDISLFRFCLRAFTTLYVGLSVRVDDYREWSEEQEWSKIDYYKTNLEDILLKDFESYTTEDYAFSQLRVYDIISNFTASVKRFDKTMNLFLDFTAKAADINQIQSFLGSTLQLAEISEYYTFSNDNSFFESAGNQTLSQVRHIYDFDRYDYEYLYQLLEKNCSRFNALSANLAGFNDEKRGAITILKPYQDEAKANITNTITVATFFSAITATTIQFSYQTNGSPLQSSVNVFWMCSLVLSVASVLDSLLAYLWRQAITSPASRTSKIYSDWIIQSPMLLLSVSVVMYSLGLYIFAFSSNQRLATALSTAVFAFCGFMSLVVPFAHFVLNRHSTLFMVGKKSPVAATSSDEAGVEYTKFEGTNLSIQDKYLSDFSITYASFSPNGRCLSAYGRGEQAIFKIMDSTEGNFQLLLKSTIYSECDGICWSPDSQYCIFVGRFEFWIWNSETFVKINSFRMGETISWFGSSSAFLVTHYHEHKLLRFDLHKLNLELSQEATAYGKLIVDSKGLNRVEDLRVLCAVQQSAHGNCKALLYGLKSSIGNVIMVYNIGNGRIERKIATLHDFVQIVPDRSGRNLIMRTKKIIQLWKFNTDCQLLQIVPLGLYNGENLMDCCFGGQDDKYALAITNKHIYFWSTTPVKYLNSFRNAKRDYHIAWNPAANESFMFITWNRGDKLNIWGTSPAEDIEKSRNKSSSDMDSQTKLLEVTADATTLDNTNDAVNVTANSTDHMIPTSRDEPHSLLNVDGRDVDDGYIDTSTRRRTVLPDEARDSNEYSTTDAQTSQLEKGKAKAD